MYHVDDYDVAVIGAVNAGIEAGACRCGLAVKQRYLQ